MKLPNFEKAKIPKAKITEYLLSFSHRDGRGKAKFFSQFGFSADSWQELAGALRQHAVDHEITKEEKSRFGTRYVIEGKLSTTDGKNPIIRSVWFVPSGEKNPWFATLRRILLNGGVHD